jgi:hypothetical protein
LSSPPVSKSNELLKGLLTSRDQQDGSSSRAHQPPRGSSLQVRILQGFAVTVPLHRVFRFNVIDTALALDVEDPASTPNLLYAMPELNNLTKFVCLAGASNIFVSIFLLKPLCFVKKGFK